jgi:hypothetical protein
MLFSSIYKFRDIFQVDRLRLAPKDWRESCSTICRTRVYPRLGTLHMISDLTLAKWKSTMKRAYNFIQNTTKRPIIGYC